MVAVLGLFIFLFSFFYSKKEPLLYILSRVIRGIRVTRFKNFPSRTRWRETNRESRRGGLAEGVIRHILPPRSRGEISRRFTTLGWTGYMQTTNRWEINLNETNLRGYRQPGVKYFIFLSFSFHSVSILL